MFWTSLIVQDDPENFKFRPRPEVDEDSWRCEHRNELINILLPFVMNFF